MTDRRERSGGERRALRPQTRSLEVLRFFKALISNTSHEAHGENQRRCIPYQCTCFYLNAHIRIHICNICIRIFVWLCVAAYVRVCVLAHRLHNSENALGQAIFIGISQHWLNVAALWNSLPLRLLMALIETLLIWPELIHWAMPGGQESGLSGGWVWTALNGDPPISEMVWSNCVHFIDNLWAFHWFDCS